MFSSGYLQGIIQTFAYKYVRDPLLRYQPDVSLATLNMYISFSFIFLGASGVTCGFVLKEYIRFAEQEKIRQILLSVCIGATFLVHILSYGVGYLDPLLSYFVSFIVNFYFHIF